MIHDMHWKVVVLLRYETNEWVETPRETKRDLQLRFQLEPTQDLIALSDIPASL